MKKVIFTLWLIPFTILLIACGNGEYDQSIDDVIEFHHDDRNGMFASAYEHEIRENGNIVVHDNGKYIFLSFYDPENDMREGDKYYYERAGETWNRLEQFEGQAMIGKTPEYQEQLGEELID
ncbi:cystatin-like fold lipoprotein [Alkalicoccobacillus gibsonii]|uniref:cystatin-like fold lipoprotein n=1 Tax=Alkalicoccobacillus gibsonii TaxID=79881 RepID=UPI0019321F73|nr:cystatin-like fold lipoprotein [Alkalicoccobacillus gibsonii]MBM0066766.1 cystatin-like fold lipoprotein [Alkalicoccobacillus gibsonii]